MHHGQKKNKRFTYSKIVLKNDSFMESDASNTSNASNSDYDKFVRKKKSHQLMMRLVIAMTAALALK